MSSESRIAWTYVQILLAKLLSEPPKGMDPRLAASLPEADRALGSMWHMAGKMTGEAAAPPLPRAARLRVGDTAGLAVVMPPTHRAPEAFFVASLLLDGTWRCYAWERAMFGDPVLAQLSDGQRWNMGGRAGPATLEVFCRHLSDAIGQEVTITEAPAGGSPWLATLLAVGLLLLCIGGGVALALVALFYR